MTIVFVDIKTAGGAGQLVQHTQTFDAAPDLLVIRWADGSVSTVTFARTPAPPAPPAAPAA